MKSSFVVLVVLLGVQLVFGVTLNIRRGNSLFVPETSAWVIRRRDEPGLYWTIVGCQILIFAWAYFLNSLKHIPEAPLNR